MPKLANLNKPAGYAFSRRIGYIGLVSFDLNEIETLRSYEQIALLFAKKVFHFTTGFRNS
jgi:hypothetical protein